MQTHEILLTLSFVITYLLFAAAVGIIVYKKSYELGERRGYSKGAGFICNEIRRIITEPNPLIKTVAWIPTEERPPDRAGRYIVHIKDFAYATDLHYDERDGFYDEYDDGERVYYNVMHWADFPEIPDGRKGLKSGRTSPPVAIGDEVYAVLCPFDECDPPAYIEAYRVYGVGVTKDGKPFIINEDMERFMLDDEDGGLSFSTRERAEKYLENHNKIQ